MMFEFATSNRIIFGNGALKRIQEIAPEFGKTPLIVGGCGSVPMDGLLASLDGSGIKYGIFRIEKEPYVRKILAGLKLA